ncbi:MAG: hypothetical protein FWE10_07385 [Rikenellaceae bacterium]|nr:hypothetical protein [Rikenellaceae bacterium]
MLVQYSGLVLLVPLTALIVEDFRSRTVGLGWLVALAVISALVSVYIGGLRLAVTNTALNALLLLYLTGGIAVYVRMRRGRWMNPLKEYIGAGDVLFLAALVPLFDLRGYLLFMIGASVFSLLWAKSRRRVPFVATAGIALSVVLIYRSIIV